MIHHPHKTFNDNRGSYTPISTKILNIEWDQCSISVNDKIYTFRGLHYQTNPPQTKYIKVIKGSILDISVDLHTNEVQSLVMNNEDAVFIPDDRAHGFLTLEPNTIVCYLVKGEYNPDSEKSIVWSSNEKVKDLIELFSSGYNITISEKDNYGK